MSSVVQVFEYKYKNIRDLNNFLIELQNRSANNVILDCKRYNNKTAWVLARVEVEVEKVL